MVEGLPIKAEMSLAHTREEALQQGLPARGGVFWAALLYFLIPTTTRFLGLC